MPTKLKRWLAFKAAVGTRDGNRNNHSTNSAKKTARAVVTADKAMTLRVVSWTNQDCKTAPRGVIKAAETSEAR